MGTRDCWLDTDEQAEVVDRLVDFGLVKYDNARKLPLKSGGMTDVYINLRDARSKPESMRFVASLFENPLRRGRFNRFAEVPDAVSCFAGPLAISLNMPYVTVREKPKEGRVAKASIIGALTKGEEIALIDDVITDGESKLAPYRELVAAGTKPTLVVLVDRQQGWQKKFADEQVDMTLWPGMRLHDVRRFLIGSGAMRRCDPKAEETNPIIVALDGKSWDEMLPIVDRLRTTGCILKVNDALMAAGTDNLIPNLSVYGRVMADLKVHDISNTAGNICARLKATPPWAVTVHASGGEEMIKAAVKALEGTPTKVLAVTVLTSIDPKTCEEIYSRLPLDQVLKLAEIAVRGGAHGFVCSGEEVKALKEKFPQIKTFVVPGVRSPGEPARDQKRVVTPAEAIGDGATNIVMGNQLLGKSDPVAEMNHVLKEELKVA